LKLARRLFYVTTLCLLSASSGLFGATYLVPQDRELIERADAIVLATATSERSFEHAGSIYTAFNLRVEQVLKGNLSVSEQLTITEIGGTLGARSHLRTGTPHYEVGERVLVFLEESPLGYQTWGMGLGKFSFVRTGEEREVLLRGVDDEGIFGWDAAGKQHVEPVRDAQAFLRFIRANGEGSNAEKDYFLSTDSATVRSYKNVPIRPNVAPGPVAYTLRNFAAGRNYYWSPPSFSMDYNGSPSGVPGIISGAMAIWNNDPNSSVNIRLGNPTTRPAGEQGPCPGGGLCFRPDGANVIQFNATTPAGVIGYTDIIERAPRPGEPDSHPKDLSTRYLLIGEADIRIAPGQANQDLIAHELGHALGLRHSDQSEGAPWSTDALMKVNAGGRGGLLKKWDKLALSTVYGPTTMCPSPIETQPNSPTIIRGQSANLSVNVGTQAIQPLRFQWYRGNTGDTSNPLGTTNPISVSPTSNTSYWVRVTNGCDTTQDSDAALVTVTDCTAPTITTQPLPQSVTSGQSAILTVVATGPALLTFQWYEVGLSGTVVAPGSTSTTSTYTTPTLTAGTSYFVRVTSCGTSGPSRDSNTVRISITGAPCNAPVIVTQPASVSVDRGQTATFTVAATGTEPLVYQWYRGDAPIDTAPEGTNSNSFTTGALTFTTNFWVKVSNACGFANSNTATATVSIPPPPCSAPAPPLVFVVNQVQSGVSYTLTLPELESTISRYEVQESTTPDFTADVTTRTLTSRSTTYSHSILPPRAVAYYYRARAFATCDGSASAFSQVSRTVVIPDPFPVPPLPTSLDLTASVDNLAPVQYQFILLPPAGLSNVPFVVTTDQPWISVTPSSGIAPSNGIILTITITPSGLPLGTSQATIQISFTTAKSDSIHATTTVVVPLGISVATPVTPAPKGAQPPDNALIIPAVTHATGVGAEFVSDVRITNTAAQPVRYQLTFTPSATNGTQTGRRTLITIQPEQTTAMNDIVKNWYGLGLLNDGATGVLEIRPENYLNKNGEPEAGDVRAAAFTTVGSSRTYAKTSFGTLGQFIPAISFSKFVGITTDPLKPTTLSLQQIAQSSFFRTNLGLVEASGQPATVNVSVFNGRGTRLGEFVENLQAAEHRQFNGYLASKGITDLVDGRIEVRVTSATGRITAYASVLDNVTQDPLLVSPVRLSDVRSNKYVVPGIADIKTGTANWRSDVRVFNPSTTPITATLRFYPQGAASAPIVRQISVAAGEVQAMDNLLETLFGVTNTAGALHIETANESSLVVTARTYDQRPSGTYGQFIPAIVQDEAAGLGERPLQVLQLEQSASFRSNLGLAEVSGQPVTVQITAIVPNAAASPVRTETLAANEFRQLNGILAQMNVAPAYNARIVIRVVGGNGRVTAYGSMVDNLTQDPTYIPAQ